MSGERGPEWAQDYAARLVQWIGERVAGAGAGGAVVGLSGGLDSAVTAALCARAFPETTLALFMPCHSDPDDGACARETAEALGLELRTVVLDDVYDRLVGLMGAGRWGRMARANLKVRLRMVTLYAHANQLNRLVVGTSNAAEIAAGYFTKYGDGAADIIPLANLVKGEVRELARHLGVPRRVIDRPPSAGLWRGQTDEEEMGLGYDLLDACLRGEAVDPEVARRVADMRRRSEHKRRPPQAPGF